jgi:hypothetical protein
MMQPRLWHYLIYKKLSVKLTNLPTYELLTKDKISLQEDAQTIIIKDAEAITTNTFERPAV